MSGKGTVLVTGGSGFIGSWCIIELRCPTAPSCDHIKPRQCPILIASDCQCYTENLQSDVIYNVEGAIEREIEGLTEPVALRLLQRLGSSAPAKSDQGTRP